MHGVLVDLEDLALEIRRRAGLAPDDYAVVTDIAVALVGEAGLVVDPEISGSTYVLENEAGFQIVVRLDAPDIRFRLMHECAHVALRTIARAKLNHRDEERAANYVAAATLAPRDLVKRAHAFYGEKPRTLARAFGLSQTAMVLRLAEVLGDERAVVTKTDNVLSRGKLWSRLPTVAVARGDAPLRGLAKAQLRGGIDEGRIALRAK